MQCGIFLIEIEAVIYYYKNYSKVFDCNDDEKAIVLQLLKTALKLRNLSQ